jgi:VanZ family protein
MARGARRQGGARFLTHWLPVLAYLTVIFILSAQQNLKPPVQFENSDKLYHLAEYGGLGLLLARATRASGRFKSNLQVGLVVLCLGIVVATCDELFQSTVPGRESSGFDLMADTIGLAIAQFVYAAWSRG